MSLNTQQKWSLDFCLKAMSGKLINAAPSAVVFSGVGTDTRVDLKGKLFFALKGDQFDAHDFLTKAVDAGASALVVHDESKAKGITQIPVIVVRDTLIALQELAQAYRKTLSGRVIAITGSNGKTTTKEFCAQLLSAKYKVHYSKGSFNNHWGVPLTLLEADSSHEVLVVEMGMNHAGEIERLVEIADPDVVLCTVVGRAHIEHFGSEEKIAEAKAEIYKFSRQDVIGIFNLDNKWTQKMSHDYSKKQNYTFSFRQSADVSFQISNSKLGEMQIEGIIAKQKISAKVSVFGEQNVTNLMAAASVGLALGMTAEEIGKNLVRCETNWGRNQILKSEKGATIIFDGYNANPDSMHALLDNLKLLPGKDLVGVFGEMRELGENAAQLHYEFGKECGQKPFSAIWFYGPHCEDFARGVKSSSLVKNLMISDIYKEELASEVLNMLKTESVVICKASRGMKIERFVELLHPYTLSGKPFSSKY